MAKIVNLPVALTRTEEDLARAETERNRRLFEWADSVLKQLGVDRAVAATKSIEEVAAVTFDADSVEVMLAVRAALKPAGRRPEEHFRGLTAGGLKQILKNRFTELKKARLATLRQRHGSKQPHWSEQLILNRDGKIVANVANLILMLQHAPKWAGVLAYDEFTVRAIIRKRPPWGAEAADTPWTDQHEIQTRVWFQKAGINPTLGDVGRAVQAAARHNPYHPVLHYLESLVWDRKPRLEAWLPTYFRAEDSEYVRAVGARYLISAVARVYKPGCKVDHTLVLEGQQGRLKSEALRTLAVKDEWFADRLGNIASKDSILEIAGVWIVELAEMDALMKAAASTIKAFLTRRRDRFRPPWGRHTISLPRQCVFAGSINPTVGGYLKDPTGARRFWPVTCKGRIDRDGLQAVRDQLWAEAVQQYKQGKPWWLETPKLEALATVEQRARFVVDAWEAAIQQWLGNRRIDVSILEVLNALGLAEKDWTQRAQNRVANILTHLGFTRYRSRRPGRPNRYRREPSLAKKIDQ